MEEYEYITYKALMNCDEGSAPGMFTPSYNQTVKINSCKVSTAMDKIPLTNIPNFVVCKKTQKPCVPVPTAWEDTYPVKVKGQQTLIGKSCINCTAGGKIGFQTSGQVPLTPEEEEMVNGMRDDVKKAYDAEQEEKNKPWWKKAGEFIVDCVPVVGPIVSMAKNISEGNWGMAAMDLGFLALDVGGLVAAPFTGGASVVGATAVKVGARQAIKAGVKQVAKKLSKEALEAAAKQTAEMISKLSVRSISGGRLCVFACFPGGTPVRTEHGIRPIETIRTGDMVWAFNEQTGEAGLQPVLQTIRNEAYVLVNIQVGNETITATPEHPFFVNGSWKVAGLLEPGEEIDSLSGAKVKINAVTYTGAHAPVESDGGLADDEGEALPGGAPVKVYNFEVAGWHTYFVGLLNLLVHNAKKGVCVKEAVDKFRRSMSERRKALLRDAEDEASGLSDKARDFIKKNDGNKVPKGHEVSHEVPLYTAKTPAGKRSLDKAPNMKTQQKAAHRKRHKFCGDQYHEYGPANNPKPDKMID